VQRAGFALERRLRDDAPAGQQLPRLAGGALVVGERAPEEARPVHERPAADPAALGRAHGRPDDATGAVAGLAQAVGGQWTLTVAGQELRELLLERAGVGAARGRRWREAEHG